MQHAFKQCFSHCDGQRHCKRVAYRKRHGYANGHRVGKRFRKRYDHSCTQRVPHGEPESLREPLQDAFCTTHAFALAHCPADNHFHPKHHFISVTNQQLLANWRSYADPFCN